jgi:hypothetical protein
MINWLMKGKVECVPSVRNRLGVYPIRYMYPYFRSLASMFASRLPGLDVMGHFMRRRAKKSGIGCGDDTR